MQQSNLTYLGIGHGKCLLMSVYAAITRYEVPLSSEFTLTLAPTCHHLLLTKFYVCNVFNKRYSQQRISRKIFFLKQLLNSLQLFVFCGSCREELC